MKTLIVTVTTCLLCLFCCVPVFANELEAPQMISKEEAAKIIEDYINQRDGLEQHDEIENSEEIEIEPEQEFPEQEELQVVLVSYDIPANSGFKTYMSYDVFSSSSSQGALQQLAVTDAEGIRVVNGRYCIAIGTRFESEIGQYVDLILANGVIIPCIVGDKKAAQHTDASNTFSPNGCCSEFIVDINLIKDEVKQRGNMSYNRAEWDSRVSCMTFYHNNALKQ